MVKKSGSKCKLCRRAGEKLFLKGDRCLSAKCAIVRKPYAPGMHGQTRNQKNLSEYGKQLAQKQKIKRIYGVSEKQLQGHFEEAKKQKGILGDNIIARLEMRLDNVVYQLKLAPSRVTARQLVGHGHFFVNDRKCNIPSRWLKIGDKILLKKEKTDKPYFKNLKTILKKDSSTPGWLELDSEKMEGKILSKPTKDEVGVRIDTQGVIEYYSR